MKGSDRHAVATRLRALLGAQLEDLAETARELHVEELSLRLSVDKESPHPTLEVLLAIVTCYGIDPGYLLTGTYDHATHRKVLEGDHRSTVETVRELAMEMGVTGAHRLRDSGELTA